MAVTMEQVRRVLDPDEPLYELAAEQLGPDALPHLETIVRQSDEGLAAKAVYLASLIQSDRSSQVVEAAAGRQEAVVRVAAAAGAKNVAQSQRTPLVLRLLDDDDVGVRKLALRAVPRQPEAALAAKVAALAQTEQEPALRSLAQEVQSR